VVGSNFTAEVKEIRIDYTPVAGAFPSSRGGECVQTEQLVRT